MAATIESGDNQKEVGARLNELAERRIVNVEWCSAHESRPIKRAIFRWTLLAEWCSSLAKL